VVVALAARRPADIELQRHGRAHGVDGGDDGGLRQQRAAEVGV
jgi:hypothetical protein